MLVGQGGVMGGRRLRGLARWAAVQGSAAGEGLGRRRAKQGQGAPAGGGARARVERMDLQ